MRILTSIDVLSKSNLLNANMCVFMCALKNIIS